MHAIDWVGYAAGALTTVAFLPQALKVWKTRTTRDVSMAMFVIFCAGVICWLTYGLMLGAVPIIIANIITLIIAASILVAKVRFG